MVCIVMPTLISNEISDNPPMPDPQTSFRLEKEMLLSAQNLGVHVILEVLGKNGCPYVTASKEVSVGTVIPDVLIGCWHSIPDWKPRALSTVESAVIAYL